MLSNTLVLAVAVVAVLAIPPCPNLVNIIESNSMTPKTRKEVLRVANDFRQRFAAALSLPDSDYMETLEYSKSLEKTAQKITNTCSTTPLPGLKDANGDFVGQLIYASWSSENHSKQLAKDAFNKWSEKKYLNSETGKSISSSFLQFISASTERIGCSRLIYTTLSPTGTTRYNQMIACVYSPTGSRRGI